ncbi:hypothetical protein [Leekyejoonella antrihumi]|uniref:Uncharacterized protein n=1 Tax=Leekyejoonella antrihumi TaxID=1660198 RepID=A0A563E447_9MICO|nr:hypothetical protein [Leekyejoonella antrihumi]TWP37297.1 hypothetical protein FGL98_05935 [Leekyejoonella antrihumi]
MSPTAAPAPPTPGPTFLPLLRLAVPAALVIDAVVHLRDAMFYTPVRGALVGEAGLFRIQAVAALLAATGLQLSRHAGRPTRSARRAHRPPVADRPG